MSFAHAVIDPFNTDSYGAQVPDMYPFPTSTTTIKESTSLYSDASGAFDFAVIGSILGSLYTNNVANGMTLNSSWSVSTAFTPDASMFGVASPTDVLQYDKYRVVGFGVRLRSLLVPMTSTGVMVMCTLPGPDKLIPQAIQSSMFNRTDLLQWYDFPDTDGTGYFSTNMENYITSSRLEHFNFNSNGLEWSSRPTGPNAFAWREGRPVNSIQVAGTTVGVSEVTTSNNTGGNVNVPGSSAREDFIKCPDWSMLVLRGMQFPPSVAVANVEIIYHIEYIDHNTATVGGNGRMPPVDAGALQRIAATAAAMPFYRSLASNNNASSSTRLGFT